MHRALTRRLIDDGATEILDVADGLTLSFLATPYDDVVDFVALERLCCPFLRFAVDVSPQRGLIALTLTGPAGTAAFIRAELGLAGA